MMAEAKAIGALAREGQAPRRTIVYAAWDGEEPGPARLHRVGGAARRRS